MEKRKIHRIVTGHEEHDKYAEAFLKYGVMAVGWSNIGDISNLSKEEIKKEARIKEKKHAKTASSTLIALKEKIQKGDIVIAYKCNNIVVAVGEVVGDYEYNKKDELGSPDGLHYPHRRKVNWWEQPREFNRENLPEELSDFVKRPGTILTFGEYDLTELKNKLNKLLDKTNYNEHNNKIIESGNKLQSILTALKTKPFLILAGVSGTGKTQIARIVAGMMSRAN